MKLLYPAIFIPYGEGFTVEFPDLPGCITQGDNLEEAFEMAEDVACGWILTSVEEGEALPKPSPINMHLSENVIVNYVKLDIGEYAKKYSKKAVKKTLTIPEWLNALAEKEGLNFSQELQNAIKYKLGLIPNITIETVSTLQEEVDKLLTIIPQLTNLSSVDEKSTSSKRGQIIYYPVKAKAQGGF